MSSLDASAVVQAFSAGSAQLSAVLRANVSAWVHWRAPGSSSAAARRSLLHVAAFHGAVEAARFLIRAGADPNAVSPDDKATPLHSVCGGRPESLSEVLAVLLEAGADRELRDSLGRKPVDLLLSQARDSQLNLPEYSSDEFRMYAFKVADCPNEEAHDWTECPFAHPGEKARRRDPRVFTYTGVACPDFRKGVCKRGDECTYGHGVFECWLHPSRYRTQLCKDGPGCARRVCFFAHGDAQLRASEGPEVQAEDGDPSDASAASMVGEEGTMSRTSSCTDASADPKPAAPSPAAAPARAGASGRAPSPPVKGAAANAGKGGGGGGGASGRGGSRCGSPAVGAAPRAASPGPAKGPSPVAPASAPMPTPMPRDKRGLEHSPSSALLAAYAAAAGPAKGAAAAPAACVAAASPLLPGSAEDLGLLSASSHLGSFGDCGAFGIHSDLGLAPWAAAAPFSSTLPMSLPPPADPSAPYAAAFAAARDAAAAALFGAAAAAAAQPQLPPGPGADLGADGAAWLAARHHQHLLTLQAEAAAVALWQHEQAQAQARQRAQQLFELELAAGSPAALAALQQEQLQRQLLAGSALCLGRL